MSIKYNLIISFLEMFRKRTISKQIEYKCVFYSQSNSFLDIVKKGIVF